MGQELMTFVAELAAPDAKTFRIFLGEPCGFVLEALGKPRPTCRSSCPSASPRPIRQADRGAHRLRALHLQAGRIQARRQGGLRQERQVHAAQPSRPRALAGGKVAYVDRVEWIWRARRAGAGQRAAQRRGRHHRGAAASTCCRCSRPTRTSSCSCCEPAGPPVRVPLQPPAQAVRQRQGAPGGAYAFNQEAVPARAVGDPKELRDVHVAVHLRHAARSHQGSDDQSKTNMKKAQELLRGRLRRHAGRDHEADRHRVAQQARAGREVAAGQGRLQGRPAGDGLADAGGRRAKKDPPDEGGWHMFLTAWARSTCWTRSPTTLPQRAAARRRGSAGRATPSWRSCATQFARETDEAKKKELAEAIQVRAFEIATPHRSLGAVRQPVVVAQEHHRHPERRPAIACTGTSEVQHERRSATTVHAPILLRRLLATVPVLLIVAVLVFLMLRLTPGDPAAILAGDAASTEQIARDPHRPRPRPPILAQFVIWLGNMLRGDLGESFFFKKPVAELIGQRLEPTLALALATIIIAVLRRGAARRARRLRWAAGRPRVMGFSVLGFSVPVFVHRLLADLSVRDQARLAAGAGLPAHRRRLRRLPPAPDPARRSRCR